MTDHRPHILFVIVGVSAGTGTFCKSLGAGLRKFFSDELKVSLLTFRPDAKFPETAVNFDETFVLSSEVHNNWRRMFELPAGIFRLRNAVSEISPDLIFTIGTFSNVATALAVENMPIVMSDHLNMTQRLNESQAGLITKFFMRRAYADHLMVVASHELADDLNMNFRVNRSLVIPNGIDAAVVKNRAAETAKQFDEPYFISVGRLTAQKDIATLLRAFALTKIEQNLLIVGDGEQRDMLESLAVELGISSRVRFLGHISNPYPLIKNARGLVLSSIWEGFAYVPIEAMALGVPVISTACPSGPVEILGGGEFGLLVPPRDPEKLSQAINRLATDDALHEYLTRKSQQRAAQLSIENMARGYRDVFLNELRK